MDSKELTVVLTRGSENIDRMKKSIQDTLAMVLGFLFKDRPSTLPEGSHVFESDACRWEMVIAWGSSTHLGAPIDYMADIKCWAKSAFVEHLRYEHNQDYPRSSHCSVEIVQVVFEDLHTFVGGVSKTFPEVHDSWEPLIKASRVNF